MGRPKLDVVKVTLTINPQRLFDAQMYAARMGVDPKIVKNNSSFIRYLIDRYIEQMSKKKGIDQ